MLNEHDTASAAFFLYKCSSPQEHLNESTGKPACQAVSGTGGQVFDPEMHRSGTFGKATNRKTARTQDMCLWSSNSLALVQHPGKFMADSEELGKPHRCPATQAMQNGCSKLTCCMYLVKGAVDLEQLEAISAKAPQEDSAEGVCWGSGQVQPGVRHLTILACSTGAQRLSKYTSACNAA